TLTDTKILYRITVASTSSSLSSSGCSYTASSNKIVVAVNCLIVLPTSVTLGGQLHGETAQLQWISTNESPNTRYIIERSDNDQQHFKPIATIYGDAPDGSGDTYNYTDPTPVTGQAYYRVNITENKYHNYSKMILLSNTAIDFAIK